MKFLSASLLGLLFGTNASAATANCEFRCAPLTKTQKQALPMKFIDNLPGALTDVCLCSNNSQISMLKFKKGNNDYFLEKKAGIWHKSKLTELKQELYTVRVQHSFYKDGLSQGLSSDVLHQTENMFKERIRFNSSLHKDDIIKLLVEHRAKQDIVLMASLKQKHNQLTAMRFLSHGQVGFYDQQGHALVEGFDRVPIKYRRISSPFRKSRKHPILGYARPHKGVDLAANSGTPIHATSSGEIVSLGALRGYGRAIIIKHKGNYQTLYAHMHAYAKGLKVGDHVHRKQLIGYVGMTGLATSPHCHYEFRIGNVAYDPMKVKLPEGERLSGARLKRFQTKWQQGIKILQG